MKPQMNADERRFLARVYIALARLFLSEALCKDQAVSPQSAPNPQRGGGAGGKERMEGGGTHARGAALFMKMVPKKEN